MFEPGLPLVSMIVANIIIAMASALHASVGIGLALLAVPPIALVLQHARPAQVRAMLSAFFLVAYVGSVVALTVFGLYGMRQVQWAAGLLPGVVAGLGVAPLLVGCLNPARLRVALLSISAASAVILLLR